MACNVVKGVAGRPFAIVCTRGHRPRPCAECGKPSTLLCDFTSTIKPGTTCDRPLCPAHAKSVGPGRDYCRRHPSPGQTAVDVALEDLGP